MSEKLADRHLSRITAVAEVRSGEPSIRGTRMAVKDVLAWLAAGATEEEILEVLLLHGGLGNSRNWGYQ